MSEQLRVLYLANTAGVFSPVAKWLNENGHEAKICTRTIYDLYQHTSVLDCALMIDGSAKDFYKAAIRLIRDFKPNIIHVNSSLELLVISRFVAWRTPIIMTFHGTDVRNKSRKVHPTARLADFIHVTTPDLKPYGEWIDRPIDPMFYDHNNRIRNTALMYYSDRFYKDNRQEAKTWCDHRGFELTILDKSDPDFKPIPNQEMPEFLSRFEYLLDWKEQKGVLQALSKIAIEALSCGVSVIHDSDKLFPILPNRFKPETPERYFMLYQSLSRASLVKTIMRLPRIGIGVFRLLFGRLKRDYYIPSNEETRVEETIVAAHCDNCGNVLGEGGVVDGRYVEYASLLLCPKCFVKYEKDRRAS